MLELRPNCELCDKDLPPQSKDARICSYECTYCAECVEKVLQNVCPTCGGGFAPRPIRPIRSWRPEEKLGLINNPASAIRVHSKYTMDDTAAHVARIRHLAPEER
ncbi:MAG: DUF1272 domain-containing protein [Aestuariivirga sp.]|uniref:DUF1272 domain-containing protein n=1 Tax=Aestuariivirga sp. TaxID=2650926 RepID=UPI0025B91F22|nr:DUF1272 domain-containing protein [Aestuariivirga sp.]MCA3559437.1 DUF1272 domain-containing protein [Aestuariivirga sp.]